MSLNKSASYEFFSLSQKLNGKKKNIQSLFCRLLLWLNSEISQFILQRKEQIYSCGKAILRIIDKLVTPVHERAGKKRKFLIIFLDAFRQNSLIAYVRVVFTSGMKNLNAQLSGHVQKFAFRQTLMR